MRNQLYASLNWTLTDKRTKFTHQLLHSRFADFPPPTELFCTPNSMLLLSNRKERVFLKALMCKWIKKLAFSSVPRWVYSNLCKRGAVDGWSSRLEEVGCQCVCALAVQNKPINIPGFLGSWQLLVTSCSSTLRSQHAACTKEKKQAVYWSNFKLQYSQVMLLIHVYNNLSQMLFRVMKGLAVVKVIANHHGCTCEIIQRSCSGASLTFFTLTHTLSYMRLCWLI